MNVKEAMRIIKDINDRGGLTSDQARDLGAAEGFLEAVEKFKPMVEALEMTLEWLEFHNYSLQATPLRKRLESYRRDVLGEK